MYINLRLREKKFEQNIPLCLLCVPLSKHSVISEGIIATKLALFHSTFQASKIMQATQNKKHLLNPTRGTGNNIIRRKLFILATLGKCNALLELIWFQ